jgi:hypothetical protein
MNAQEELLSCARASAEACPYYDHAWVPDAGNLAHRIVDAANASRWDTDSPQLGLLQMTTVSESLSQASLPTLQANHETRKAILELYRRTPPTSAAGVFGKTLWVFTADRDLGALENSPTSVQKSMGRVTDSLTPADYGDTERLHLRGWVSAVASALKRKFPQIGGRDSRELVHAVLARLKNTDWESPAQAEAALGALKAFTQPTWWTTLTPDPAIRRGHDLHFTALYSERQYRQDALHRRLDDCLLVTDVPGLFLGSARKVTDLERMATGDSFPVGIAGTILRSLTHTGDAAQDLLRAAFLGRIKVAGDLSQTLRVIARCADPYGGRTYATHGDGVSVIMPASRYRHFARELELAESDLALPVAIGSAPLDHGLDRAEVDAERSLWKIKTSTQPETPFAHVLTDAEDEAYAQPDVSNWQAMANSRDAVERWMGAKQLRSFRLWSSI